MIQLSTQQKNKKSIGAGFSLPDASVNTDEVSAYWQEAMIAVQPVHNKNYLKLNSTQIKFSL